MLDVCRTANKCTLFCSSECTQQSLLLVSVLNFCNITKTIKPCCFAIQIWVTVSKSGLKSAVYFWPGSEAKIQGRRPDYYYAYNEETSFEERFQTVLTWLDLPQALRWVTQ